MSSEGAVDFLQDRVTNVVEDMADRISLSVLQGAAAPAARRFTSLETLNGIGSTTGWFQGVAPAVQTNTVLGLSQASFRDFGWFSQFANAGGGLTEADVRNVMTGIRAQSGMNPDVCICSEEYFNKLAGWWTPRSSTSAWRSWASALCSRRSRSTTAWRSSWMPAWASTRTLALAPTHRRLHALLEVPPRQRGDLPGRRHRGGPQEARREQRPRADQRERVRS
jgi:hypothetical protein